jgi:hypothetical protein
MSTEHSTDSSGEAIDFVSPVQFQKASFAHDSVWWLAALLAGKKLTLPKAIRLIRRLLDDPEVCIIVHEYNGTGGITLHRGSAKSGWGNAKSLIQYNRLG